MDDVAKVIGKSRSALYYYYKNRDEIFDAVMEMLIGNVADEIIEAVDKAGTWNTKKISAFLETFKTWSLKNIYHFSIILIDQLTVWGL